LENDRLILNIVFPNPKRLKKAFAIFFLSLFLFNVGGYYIVFWVLQFQYDLKIASIIQSGSYQKDETVELKIPMSLPYPLQPRDFERISGKFEYQGEYYELVKQKLDNDTLHVVCLKNHDKHQLVSTITNYVKLSNDLPGTAQKAFNFLGKLLKEYNPSNKPELSFNVALVDEITFMLFDFSDTPHPIQDIPSPPPRA
jgi:hypothetical protein